MEQNVFYALSARKVVLKVHYKIKIYAIGIYPICLYEQQGNSTFVSVRHTHFKAKIGVPPFPCTVGVNRLFIGEPSHVECGSVDEITQVKR